VYCINKLLALRNNICYAVWQEYKGSESCSSICHSNYYDDNDDDKNNLYLTLHSEQLEQPKGKNMQTIQLYKLDS